MLNALRDLIFSENKKLGWHTTEPKIGDFVANLHSEVSEFWEAYRKSQLNSPCDKAEKMQALCNESLTCAEEELADIVIRALDTAAVLGVDMDRAVKVKMAYNATRPHRHGGKLA